jgi:hypothetical protein
LPNKTGNSYGIRFRWRFGSLVPIESIKPIGHVYDFFTTGHTNT